MHSFHHLTRIVVISLIYFTAQIKPQAQFNDEIDNKQMTKSILALKHRSLQFMYRLYDVRN